MSKIICSLKEDGCEDASKYWLVAAVLSLAAAGVCALLIALMRVSYLSYFFNEIILFDISNFKTLLVLHVNFSVLIWFLTIICYSFNVICYSLYWHQYFAYYIFVNKIIKYILFILIFILLISPFVIESRAIMNNYIPMLEDNILFSLALGLFFTIITFYATFVLIVNIYNLIYLYKVNYRVNHTIRIIDIIYSISSSLIIIISIINLSLSFCRLNEVVNDIWLNIDHYYELLFWGQGHVMQYLYCNLMLYIYIKFLYESNNISKIMILLFILNIIFVSFTLWPYIYYQIIDAEFTIFFTNNMKYFGAISIIIFVIFFVIFNIKYINRNYNCYIKNNLKNNAIICSLLLFFIGGFISLFIKEINCIIPAHYHGMIVGVTIISMAYIYDRLDIYNSNFSNLYYLANKQIIILFAGQILHIIPLALAGGYGAMRKSPGEILSINAKIYMTIMGFGGIIATIGGILFIYIAIKLLMIQRKNIIYAEK